MKYYGTTAAGPDSVTHYQYGTGEWVDPNVYGGIDNLNSNAPHPWSDQLIRSGMMPMQRGGPNAFSIGQKQYRSFASLAPVQSELGFASALIDAHQAGGMMPPDNLSAPSYTHRDVAGSGGYVYRQFSNGNLQVMKGPALVGTKITSSGDPLRWKAITNEIGKWGSLGSGKIRSGAAQGAASLIDAWAAGKQQRLEGGAMMPYAPPVGSESTAWSLEENWKILALGAAGIVALALIVK